LCSVVASAHELRKLGSRADMVLMVQITAESSHEKLTDFEEGFFAKDGHQDRLSSKTCEL